MDDLNKLLRHQRVPQALRHRLREYFHQTHHLMRAHARQVLLSQMSPMLQGELALELNKKWLENVPFLWRSEPQFVVQVAMSLTGAVYVPGELPPPGFLYMISRGVGLFGGKVLMAGGCWGQDVILRSRRLRRLSALPLTYLEVYRIGREEILDLASCYPIAQSKIRWEVRAPRPDGAGWAWLGMVGGVGGVWCAAPTTAP
eukprot:7349520-Prymnesium_polylepis.1